MIKEAVILVGGQGTRLQAVVSDRPKPMALVAGRPFLTYVLDELSRQGIEKVILASGFLHEQLADFFGAHYAGMQIAYSHESRPLGTGGAILQAMPQLSSPEVLVLNGDTFFQVDLSRMYRFFRQQDADLLMALKPMQHFDRYGTVGLAANGRVEGFSEKTYCADGLINGGVYLLHTRLFGGIALPGKFSFESEILEKRYNERALFGMAFDAYFIDIGIPQDYQRAQHDFSSFQA